MIHNTPTIVEVLESDSSTLLVPEPPSLDMNLYRKLGIHSYLIPTTAVLSTHFMHGHW